MYSQTESDELIRIPVVRNQLSRHLPLILWRSIERFRNQHICTSPYFVEEVFRTVSAYEDYENFKELRISVILVGLHKEDFQNEPLLKDILTLPFWTVNQVCHAIMVLSLLDFSIADIRAVFLKIRKKCWRYSDFVYTILSSLPYPDRCRAIFDELLKKTHKYQPEKQFLLMNFGKMFGCWQILNAWGFPPQKWNRTRHFFEQIGLDLQWIWELLPAHDRLKAFPPILNQLYWTTSDLYDIFYTLFKKGLSFEDMQESLLILSKWKISASSILKVLKKCPKLCFWKTFIENRHNLERLRSVFLDEDIFQIFYLLYKYPLQHTHINEILRALEQLPLLSSLCDIETDDWTENLIHFLPVLIFHVTEGELPALLDSNHIF